MLFNSAQFALIFPLITIAYFVLAPRFRWFLLLAASCYFYMAFIPVYILILFFTIFIDYFAGLLIEDARGARRRFYLLLSILANVGVLALFKYYNFLNTSLLQLFGAAGLSYPIPHLDIILPIGLSFHTFQSLSYTIEVYRGAQKAERHLGLFALYVMYYPQLVAGPIERPQNLLHQLREPHAFDYARVADGLKLMAWGLFKKVVIADRLAVVVDQVYGNPVLHNPLGLTLATLFFAYQIYCDFSGYSDIAIGAAQVMGVRLMQNFRQPYLAQTISEFWKRWHISLSTWFRDYLYVPLGGNRVTRRRWQFNLMVVFAVSGLWHGANWTYVIWGVLHGAYTIVTIWLTPWARRAAGAVRLDPNGRVARNLLRLCTFSMVCFAWIFFRAATVGDAFFVAQSVLDLRETAGLLLNPATLRRTLDAIGFAETVPALAGLVVLEIVHVLQQKGSVRARIATCPAAVRWALYASLLLVIGVWGRFGNEQFIYFQF
jgi:alginate O-acetyltransferase complex protein AlgI